MGANCLEEMGGMSPGDSWGEKGGGWAQITWVLAGPREALCFS